MTQSQAHSPAQLRARFLGLLSSGGLTTRYLPIFDLRQRRMEALEAEIWCDSPDQADCDGTEIAASAARLGLLAELDDWWLPAVLTDVQQLHSKQNPPQVLMRLHNVEDYEQLRRRMGDCRELLLREKPILLIDETGLNRGGDPLVEVLAELGGQGYRLAIDRFGLGHTSYRQLLRLPLSWVKLDPALVVGALVREADGTQIYNIVNLAHSLNIRVIAGNIQSEEQFWLMCNVGCDFGEGEAFLAALPIHSFADMLAEAPRQRGRRVLG